MSFPWLIWFHDTKMLVARVGWSHDVYMVSVTKSQCSKKKRICSLCRLEIYSQTFRRQTNSLCCVRRLMQRLIVLTEVLSHYRMKSHHCECVFLFFVAFDWNGAMERITFAPVQTHLGANWERIGHVCGSVFIDWNGTLSHRTENKHSHGIGKRRRKKN